MKHHTQSDKDNAHETEQEAKKHETTAQEKRANRTTEDPKGPQPIPSPGKQVFDVESHKITELFEPGDVVFTREGGAGELRAQPKHEAQTRFVEIDGDIKSEFKDAQTTTSFKLKDGRVVTQKGHKTMIADGDKIDDSGPTLNIHNVDQQG